MSSVLRRSLRASVLLGGAVSVLGPVLAASAVLLPSALVFAQPAPAPVVPAAPTAAPPPAVPAAPPTAAQPVAPPPASAAPPAAAPPAVPPPAASADVPPPPPVEPPPAEQPPLDVPPPEPLPLPEPVLTDEGMEIVSSDEPADSALSLFMFADANYAVTSSHRTSPSVYHRAFEGNGADGTAANGFALEWLGLDANYDGGEVGATASLRFGDAVPIYLGGDRSPGGIANLTQGYLSWFPHERLGLHLGQFGTIFGAEVAESWRNLNYTRGALYYGMQPAWHTGFKGSFAFSDAFGINAMVVNGVNSSFDEDDAPSVGLQATVTPNDVFQLYVGGMQTLDSVNDSSNFDTFLDLVAVVTVGDLKGILNADFNIARDAAEDDAGNAADGSFFGVSAGLGYAFSHLIGVAARYEFLSDPDTMLYDVNLVDANGELPDDFTGETSVNTLTATLDLKPIPERDNLIIRWDNRYEFSNQDIFQDTRAVPASNWFASVLGVVVKMDE